MDIRLTEARDLIPLEAVLDGTELFASEMLADMVGGFLAGNAPDLWLTCEAGGTPIGFCYAAPEEMTDGTWNMLALAVLPAWQGAGAGAALVAHLEAVLRERGVRVLIVDTSGDDAFARTRAFYRANGYDEEARIRDFWAAGMTK